ncbi:hypothetical protein H696_06232 [Fonticula alba]|uniref:Uncharacterized protein n=1 Tax=Fonticula alba TaxID=691883 RepID=A0A058Z1D9_FONAL|nr:hypothetical protein H696_06232 [Fonticula alba]KCV67342.1 hypothetical protein H696_06232 [Fonticula alba]|eukprot:XP_009498255.1 hypothetical protein H696_06232 [Fonticula alba]
MPHQHAVGPGIPANPPGTVGAVLDRLARIGRALPQYPPTFAGALATAGGDGDVDDEDPASGSDSTGTMTTAAAGSPPPPSLVPADVRFFGVGPVFLPELAESAVRAASLGPTDRMPTIHDIEALHASALTGSHPHAVPLARLVAGARAIVTLRPAAGKPGARVVKCSASAAEQSAVCRAIFSGLDARHFGAGCQPLIDEETGRAVRSIVVLDVRLPTIPGPGAGPGAAPEWLITEEEYGLDFDRALATLPQDLGSTDFFELLVHVGAMSVTKRRAWLVEPEPAMAATPGAGGLSPEEASVLAHREAVDFARQTTWLEWVTSRRLRMLTPGRGGPGATPMRTPAGTPGQRFATPAGRHFPSPETPFRTPAGTGPPGSPAGSGYQTTPLPEAIKKPAGGRPILASDATAGDPPRSSVSMWQTTLLTLAILVGAMAWSSPPNARAWDLVPYPLRQFVAPAVPLLEDFGVLDALPFLRTAFSPDSESKAPGAAFSAASEAELLQLLSSCNVIPLEGELFPISVGRTSRTLMRYHEKLAHTAPMHFHAATHGATRLLTIPECMAVVRHYVEEYSTHFELPESFRAQAEREGANLGQGSLTGAFGAGARLVNHWRMRFVAAAGVSGLVAPSSQDDVLCLLQAM